MVVVCDGGDDEDEVHDDHGQPIYKRVMRRQLCRSIYENVMVRQLHVEKNMHGKNLEMKEIFIADVHTRSNVVCTYHECIRYMRGARIREEHHVWVPEIHSHPITLQNI